MDPLIRQFRPKDIEGLSRLIEAHARSWITRENEYYLDSLERAGKAEVAGDNEYTQWLKNHAENFFGAKDQMEQETKEFLTRFFTSAWEPGKRYVAILEDRIVGYGEVAPASSVDGLLATGRFSPSAPVIRQIFASTEPGLEQAKSELYSRLKADALETDPTDIYLITLMSGSNPTTEDDWHQTGVWVGDGLGVGNCGYFQKLRLKPVYVFDDSTRQLDESHLEDIYRMNSNNILCSQLHHFELEQTCLRFFYIYQQIGAFAGIDFDTFRFAFPGEDSVYHYPSEIHDENLLECYISDMKAELGKDVFVIREIDGRKFYFPTEGIIEAFERSPLQRDFSIMRHLFGGELIDINLLGPILLLYTFSGESMPAVLSSLEEMGMPHANFEQDQYPTNKDEIIEWYNTNNAEVSAKIMAMTDKDTCK
jgi:hypothetical protein